MTAYAQLLATWLWNKRVHRRRNREFEQTCKLASEHVAVVIRSIDLLCPGLDPRRKTRLANKILTLADGKDRSVRITEAQARDLVMPHLQCIREDCQTALPLGADQQVAQHVLQREEG